LQALLTHLQRSAAWQETVAAGASASPATEASDAHAEAPVNVGDEEPGRDREPSADAAVSVNAKASPSAPSTAPSVAELLSRLQASSSVFPPAAPTTTAADDADRDAYTPHAPASASAAAAPPPGRTRPAPPDPQAIDLTRDEPTPPPAPGPSAAELRAMPFPQALAHIARLAADPAFVRSVAEVRARVRLPCRRRPGPAAAGAGRDGERALGRAPRAHPRAGDARQDRAREVRRRACLPPARRARAELARAGRSLSAG
jgi:hypothetical protein